MLNFFITVHVSLYVIVISGTFFLLSPIVNDFLDRQRILVWVREGCILVLCFCHRCLLVCVYSLVLFVLCYLVTRIVLVRRQYFFISFSIWVWNRCHCFFSCLLFSSILFLSSTVSFMKNWCNICSIGKSLLLRCLQAHRSCLIPRKYFVVQRSLFNWSILTVSLLIILELFVPILVIGLSELFKVYCSDNLAPVFSQFDHGRTCTFWSFDFHVTYAANLYVW